MWKTYDRQKIQPKPLMRQLMTPLSILILLCVIGSGILLYQQHRHYLHDKSSANISEMNHDMEILLHQQSSALSLAIKPIAADLGVQKALREGNSRALFVQWHGIFEKMKEENGLTHFYFMDKNRVCLARIHNPIKKGDVIDRFTALEAEWSRKISSGIEVGPMGTLTLRVVQPVIVDNELIGYIELGKEIEDVIKHLHFQSDIQLAVVLHKEYLNRAAWEEGMRLLSREGNWNLFKNDALVYSSMEKIPQPFLALINDSTGIQYKLQELDKEVYAEGKTYRVSMVELKDVSGKEVGNLFIMNNITHENLEFFDQAVLGGISGLILIGFVISFIYLLIRRTDEGIKNQQRYLYESQQRLEQLARHSRTFAWEVDAHGKFTYISDVVYEVLGYHADELIGKYFYELHPENGREAFKNAALEIFARKESFSNYKNRSMNKSGGIVWLMTNALPLLAQDGRLLGYRGNDTDITQWQKAEDAIIESHNLLYTIIDTIPIRIFWKSRTLRYMGCNTLFAHDAGLEKPNELIGKDDYQMGWSAEADAYREDDRAVMASGEAKLFYEEVQTTPNGETIWLSTSKVPLKNNHGEIIGILGTYEDITRHKEMQNSLRLTAQRLNEAQHFAHMGSWSFDLESKALVWSDEVYRIFEIDPNRCEVNYDILMDRIHPEDREMVVNAYQSSLETKEPYNVTHRLLMDDGRIRWVHESGISEFDEEGNALRSMGTVQDISERKMTEEKVEQLVFFDSLTQLPNRILLIDRLKQSMALSARNNQFGALLFIDLDNFKLLNDTLGHGVGDNLLKLSGERLRKCVREGDTVARLGGDEFVILLSDLGSEEKYAAATCELISEKILSVLGEPYDLERAPYQSTASIGITLFRGDSSSDDELMKQADLAMYKSKEAGRNGLSFFDPIMESSLKARALLEEEIRRGIEEEQFILYYQPQVYANGALFGAEALVRWNHPQRGVIAPAEFIPMAEETGLILPLGQWILEAACVQISKWSQDERFCDLCVAVNVSVRQFNQKDFVDQVVKTLQKSGADPKRLKLELTESLLVQDVEEVIEKMDRLKSIGVCFSLDDFGTGYSSLSYLKRLPLDQLKIDQGFVRDILSDPNDAIICKSTIALTESMGLSVIAEGVETKEQLDTLLALGCHAYQGYWFSRPLDRDAFEAYQRDWIARHPQEKR